MINKAKTIANLHELCLGLALELPKSVALFRQQRHKTLELIFHPIQSLSRGIQLLFQVCQRPLGFYSFSLQAIDQLLIDLGGIRLIS